MNWTKEKFQWLREKARGWKTIIVGALAAAPLALLELAEQLQLIDPASVLPEPWGQRVALAIALVMILLRLVTSGPIGKKGD